VHKKIKKVQMYPKNIHMYIDEENYEVQMKRIQELKITENK
jgi:hypothetical protein